MKKQKKRRTLASLGRLITALAALIIAVIILSAAVTPARYDIKVGQPAPNTIKATKDVVDQVTTDALKQQAAQSVRSIYYVDENAAGEVNAAYTLLLDRLYNVAALYVAGDGEATEAQLAGANERLEGFELTAEEMKVLGSYGEEELEGVFSLAKEECARIMADNLSESQLDTAVSGLCAALENAGCGEDIAGVASRALKFVIKPNYYYDEEATLAARKTETDKIQAVSRVKGEVIVSDGEIITEAQYQMLSSLGMLTEGTVDLWLYSGVALIAVLMVLGLGMYLWMFEKSSYLSFKATLIIAIACVVTMGACLVAKNVNAYFMPTTLALLILTLTIDSRTALFANMLMALIASMFSGSSSGSTFFNSTMFAVVVNTVMCGVVMLRLLNKKQLRTNILLAGLAAGVTGAITTFAVGLVNSSSLESVWSIALWAAAGQMLSAVICIAIVPLLEAVFNLSTNTKLLELSNPNNPLLRRLLLEAPGTYHHSIIVANLAEAAALDIGANGLLARVGAYFHDVGKLKRPGYFKENQLGDNPHDRTDPRVSVAIITAHPGDGLELLKSARVPPQVQEIVASHHGNTAAMYFYNKAINEGQNPDISDYRYNCPKPQTREAALVMLADTVEAAVRSLKSSDPDKINEMIKKLVSQKIDDGQLSECPLTFADIEKAEKAFKYVLSGIYHERVEYEINKS